MLTLWFSIVLVLLIIGLLFIIKTTDSSISDLFLCFLGIILIIICSLGIGLSTMKYEAYTNILKGKENPYKMEIKYNKVNDSTFVPTDTIFVEK